MKFFYKRYPNPDANKYEMLSVGCKMMVVFALLFTWIGFMANRDGESFGIFLAIGGILATVLFIVLAAKCRKKADTIMEIEGARPARQPEKKDVIKYMIVWIVAAVILFLVLQI